MTRAIIIGIFATLTVCLSVGFAIAVGTHARHVVARVLALTLTATLVCDLALAVFAGVAIAKGLWTLNTPIDEVADGVFSDKTPFDESATVEGATNVVIGFYRFGCPDCVTIHDELESWAAENNLDLVWVSTRSEVGRRLFLSQPVDQVPALMAVRTDDETLTRIAFEVDEDGHAVVNEPALAAIETFITESD